MFPRLKTLVMKRLMCKDENFVFLNFSIVILYLVFLNCSFLFTETLQFLNTRTMGQRFFMTLHSVYIVMIAKGSLRGRSQ